MIEFDRNPNALRDEILVDHSWALGQDGALAVPMDRWTLIVVFFLWLIVAKKNDVILARSNINKLVMAPWLCPLRGGL